MELDTGFRTYFYSLLLIGISLFSCKKAENRTCFKSTGKTTEKRVDLPTYKKLWLNKKLDYTLVQDDSNYLIIKGGENLVNFVKWEMYEDLSLKISNLNKCNFLRDLSHLILVEIHFTSLVDIQYEGSGYLNNKDTLQFNNFNFLIVDANGTMDLNLKSNYLSADITEGSGDFKLSGETNDAFFSSRNNGYYHAENFKVKNSLKISNKSAGSGYINANQCQLSGFISGEGNVYYSGTPNSINVEVLGKGKLIPF